jgi:hypothetical protein
MKRRKFPARHDGARFQAVVAAPRDRRASDVWSLTLEPGIGRQR